MKERKCPYCGEKVPYFTAIMEKEMGEHTCKKCGRNSTVYFVKSLRAAIIVTIIVAAAILGIWFFIGNYENLWGMLWVFLPFAVFYACTPLFYKLVPLKIGSAPQKREQKAKRAEYYNPMPASGSTKVIPNVSQVSGEFLLVDDDMEGSTKVIPTVTEDDIYGGEYMDISEIADKNK